MALHQEDYDEIDGVRLLVARIVKGYIWFVIWLFVAIFAAIVLITIGMIVYAAVYSNEPPTTQSSLSELPYVAPDASDPLDAFYDCEQTMLDSTGKPTQTLNPDYKACKQHGSNSLWLVEMTDGQWAERQDQY